MQVHLHNVRVTDALSPFNEQLVDIQIEEGAIKAIKGAKKRKINQSVIQTGDQQYAMPGIVCVSPGWVDIFADYCEPGYEQKETITTGLAAAAAGGFTHVLVTPNNQPVTSGKGAVQYILQQGAGNVVTIHPMGSVTRNAEGKELAEMMDMYLHGAQAFTDGWKPIQHSGLMLKALEYVKAFKGLVIQLPYDTSISAGTLMHEGEVSTRLGMPGAPVLAETLMLYRDIELLRYTKSRLHVTGISCAESVDLIRKAKKDGLDITCSVTPYHLAFTDDMLTTYHSVYKVTPPLRTEKDRQALIGALAEGVIDCITSHHRPHEWDAKTREFEYAADGMALQENMFSILYNNLKNYVGITQLVELLSDNPRKIFGLDNATIKKNNISSLTIFDPAVDTTVTTAGKKSKGINNPFTGKTLPGKVIGIINFEDIHINE
jgi:dihydroorotase